MQKHVFGLLGDSSPGLIRYQKEYERELAKPWKVSSRDQLLASLQAARVVWLGDFHALQQSQKAQLRILKALPVSGKVLLGLECIEARHQQHLDRYCQGKLTDREFLKAVGISLGILQAFVSLGDQEQGSHLRIEFKDGKSLCQIFA